MFLEEHEVPDFMSDGESTHILVHTGPQDDRTLLRIPGCKNLELCALLKTVSLLDPQTQRPR
ncbi:MAG: hypothetical protein WB679_07735 [Terracidiphilus sp.]